MGVVWECMGVVWSGWVVYGSGSGVVDGRLVWRWLW